MSVAGVGRAACRASRLVASAGAALHPGRGPREGNLPCRASAGPQLAELAALGTGQVEGSHG